MYFYRYLNNKSFKKCNLTRKKTHIILTLYSWNNHIKEWENLNQYYTIKWPFTYLVGRIIEVEDVCCSNQKLDKTTQVCCGKTFLRGEEIVHKSAPYHDKCCPTRGGGVSYDSVNFVCSYEYRVVNKSMLDPRCGRQKYDPMKDLCCNYKLFKHALKDGMSCCQPSASIYNPNTDVCCFGKRQKGKR